MAAVSPENERNAESAWRLPPSFPLFLIGFVMEGFPPNDVTLLHAVKNVKMYILHRKCMYGYRCT